MTNVMSQLVKQKKINFSTTCTCKHPHTNTHMHTQAAAGKDMIRQVPP